jgi:hypothetical protein
MMNAIGIFMGIALSMQIAIGSITIFYNIAFANL